MSFLSDLNARRGRLKATATRVTRIDGTRFMESTTGDLQEIDRSSYGFVVDTKPDRVPAQITHYLYLGSQDCCDLTVLQQYKITHILSVGIEAPTQYEDFVYLYVPCLDIPESNLDKVLKESCNFISTAKISQNKILVHCNAGVSRSASVVIAYLMLEYGHSYNKAFDIVKKVRSCIRPNDGFVNQLKSLQ